MNAAADAELSVLELGVLGGSSSLFFAGMYRRVYFADFYRPHLDSVRALVNGGWERRLRAAVYVFQHTTELPEPDPDDAALESAIGRLRGYFRNFSPSYHHLDLYGQAWGPAFGNFYPDGIDADIAVIDADHRYRPVLSDLDHVLRIPRMRFVALHDFGVSVDVQRAVLETEAEGKLRCGSSDSNGDGAPSLPGSGGGDRDGEIGVQLEQHCLWFGRDTWLRGEGVLCSVERGEGEAVKGGNEKSADKEARSGHAEVGVAGHHVRSAAGRWGAVSSATQEQQRESDHDPGQLVVSPETFTIATEQACKTAMNDSNCKIATEEKQDAFNVAPALLSFFFQDPPAQYGVPAKFVSSVRASTSRPPKNAPHSATRAKANSIFVRDVRRKYHNVVRDLLRRLLILFAGHWLHGTTVWRTLDLHRRVRLQADHGRRRDFLLVLKPFLPEAEQGLAEVNHYRAAGDDDEITVLNPGPTQFCHFFDPEPFRDYYSAVSDEIVGWERKAGREFLSSLEEEAASSSSRSAGSDSSANGSDVSEGESETSMQDEESDARISLGVRRVLQQVDEDSAVAQKHQSIGEGKSARFATAAAFAAARMARKREQYRVPNFSDIATQPFTVHLLDASLCPELLDQTNGTAPAATSDVDSAAEDEEVHLQQKMQTGDSTAERFRRVLFEHPSRCRYDLIQLSPGGPAETNVTEAVVRYRGDDFWTHAWKFLFAKPGSLVRRQSSAKGTVEYREPGWELMPAEHWGKLFLQKVGEELVRETVHLSKKRDVLSAALALDYYSRDA
eukprot:g10881.t1